MRTQYSGSAEGARQLMIGRLVQAGWPEQEATLKVLTLTPKSAAGAMPARLRWSRERRRIEQDGAFTPDQFQQLVAFYGCCLRCGRDDVPLEPDHIVPLRKGGAHHITNIQPLCNACNFWKGVRAIDFRVGRQRWSGRASDGLLSQKGAD